MRLQRTTALIAIVGLLVLLLGCTLGGLAVRTGFVAPPTIQIELGGLRLVSTASTVPDCARLLTPGCASLHPEPTVRTYTLWILTQRQPESWNGPNITQLFQMRIDPTR